MTEYDLGKVVGDDGEAGNGIASITKTGTSGLVDTYTITYDDGTTTTFTVTNGSNASVTIQTSWGSTTSDSKVPSEKLTKDTLDTKITKSSTTGLMKNDGTVMTSGTGSGNYSAGNHTHSSYVSGSKVTSWSSTVSDSNIPSEKLVKNSLDDKISKSSTSGLVKNDGTIDTNSYLTTGTASSTYQPKLTSGTNIKTINSESILGSGNIVIQGGSSVDVVTSWEATLSDTKVPSEKLTKNTIDGKLDNALSSTTVTVASDDNILITDYSDSNKIKRVENILASQVKDGNVHSNISTLANSSQAVINNAIDMAIGNKVSKSSTSGLLKNDGTVDTTSYSTFSGSYNDLSNKPSIPSSSSDLSDGSDLVKKSSTSGLLKNDGSVMTGGTGSSNWAIGNHTHSGYVSTSDIADNLTTNDSTKVLSAKQGKALNDLIGAAITYINQ